MSRITESDAKGLMEAYNAVYAFQEQPQQLTEQTTKENYIQEDLEIDPDALLESVKEYLVTSGYAKGEKEAINMLPHLSENFFQNICSQIIITEVFYQNVNSLVEEGYDLSEYTWDELFESYVNVIDQETLNEAIPLAIPAAMAAAPYVLPALGAAAYTAKGLMDRRNKSQAKQKAEDERFLSTGSFQARKGETPAQRKARVQASQERRAQQQGTTKPVKGQQITSDKPSGGAPAGGAPPTPPSGGGSGKPPRDFGKFFKGLQNYNKAPAKGPDLGTAAGRVRTGLTALKNVLLGKTGLGLATRTAGTLGADELVASGAGREKLSQMTQSTLQRTRSAGEKEKERIRRKGEAEREKFATQEKPQPGLELTPQGTIRVR